MKIKTMNVYFYNIIQSASIKVKSHENYWLLYTVYSIILHDRACIAFLTSL